MATHTKPVVFPNYKPVVVPASQVERVLKYLRGELKVPKVTRPITYRSSAKWFDAWTEQLFFTSLPKGRFFGYCQTRIFLFSSIRSTCRWRSSLTGYILLQSGSRRRRVPFFKDLQVRGKWRSFKYSRSSKYMQFRLHIQFLWSETTIASRHWI